MDVRFRFLGPEEGAVLSEAIRAAYGDSYDVRWVYDAEEVSRRLAAGTYVACVAETESDELLCHEGMSVAEPDDAVGHSGQAVTMPAARGQHLFTRTKRFLMDWAAERGMAGMYSEATAAHPYSQLNDGHEREVYAPERHREVVSRTLELCELRGRLADPRQDRSRRRGGQDPSSGSRRAAESWMTIRSVATELPGGGVLTASRSYWQDDRRQLRPWAQVSSRSRAVTGRTGVPLHRRLCDPLPQHGKRLSCATASGGGAPRSFHRCPRESCDLLDYVLADLPRWQTEAGEVTA